MSSDASSSAAAAPDSPSASAGATAGASSGSRKSVQSLLAQPGMYLLYKYNQYKRSQQENQRRRTAERELANLNSKIDKLLAKLDNQYDNDTSRPLRQEEECVVCLSSRATMQTFPCSHTVVCRKCFVKTIQVAVTQRCLPLRCVVCRARVLKLRQVAPWRQSPDVVTSSVPASYRQRISVPPNKIHTEALPAPRPSYAVEDADKLLLNSPLVLLQQLDRRTEACDVLTRRRHPDVVVENPVGQLLPLPVKDRWMAKKDLWKGFVGEIIEEVTEELREESTFHAENTCNSDLGSPQTTRSLPCSPARFYRDKNDNFGVIVGNANEDSNLGKIWRSVQRKPEFVNTFPRKHNAPVGNLNERQTHSESTARPRLHSPSHNLGNQLRLSDQLKLESRPSDVNNCSVESAPAEEAASAFAGVAVDSNFKTPDTNSLRPHGAPFAAAAENSNCPMKSSQNSRNKNDVPAIDTRTWIIQDSKVNSHSVHGSHPRPANSVHRKSAHLAQSSLQGPADSPQLFRRSSYSSPVRQSFAHPPTFARQSPINSPTFARRSPINSPTFVRRSPINSPTVARRSPINSPTVARRSPINSPTFARRSPVNSPMSDRRNPVHSSTFATQSSIHSPPPVRRSPVQSQVARRSSRRLESPVTRLLRAERTRRHECRQRSRTTSPCMVRQRRMTPLRPSPLTMDVTAHEQREMLFVQTRQRHDVNANNMHTASIGSDMNANYQRADENAAESPRRREAIVVASFDDKRRDKKLTYTLANPVRNDGNARRGNCSGVKTSRGTNTVDKSTGPGADRQAESKRREFKKGDTVDRKTVERQSRKSSDSSNVKRARPTTSQRRISGVEYGVQLPRRSDGSRKGREEKAVSAGVQRMHANKSSYASNGHDIPSRTATKTVTNVREVKLDLSKPEKHRCDRHSKSRSFRFKLSGISGVI